MRPRIEGGTGPRRRAVYAAMEDIRASALRPEELSDTGDEAAALVRTEDWYFISYETWGVDELFDMTRDPMQRTNVAAQHPDLVARLRGDLESWKLRMDETLLSPSSILTFGKLEEPVAKSKYIVEVKARASASTGTSWRASPSSA